jgi:hypothetical protein
MMIVTLKLPDTTKTGDLYVVKSVLAKIPNSDFDNFEQTTILEKVDNDTLLSAAKAVIEYRDRVGAMGWQLEKADDYFRQLRSAIAQAEPDKAEGGEG